MHHVLGGTSVIATSIDKEEEEEKKNSQPKTDKSG